jgi:hypothetical protein
MNSSPRNVRHLAWFLPLAFAVAPLVHAQVDFSGEWAPFYHEDPVERGPGAELGDYTELPINDAARMQADSYDADRISVVEEYQCRPHSPDYGFRSLGICESGAISIRAPSVRWLSTATPWRMTTSEPSI